MISQKEKFLKRYNTWGQNHRQQDTYWYNIKFAHTKHDAEQLAYDPKVLGK